MAAEIVFVGRDNPIRRRLMAGRSVISSAVAASVTKVQVVLQQGKVTVPLNSTDHASAVKLPAADGVVELRLGSAVDFTGNYRASLTLFTADEPNGLEVEDFPVEVRNP